MRSVEIQQRGALGLIKTENLIIAERAKGSRYWNDVFNNPLGMESRLPPGRAEQRVLGKTGLRLYK